jgi:riboflavin kinase/FMN adenylyltransferase
MQVTRLEGFAPVGWPAACVAVGNFDGVHLGHQALAAAVVGRARARGGVAGALTFEPHPARVLRPERAPSALLTLDQKARLLAEAGVERLAVLPFDRSLAMLTPEEFARRVLQDALGARSVVVGENFRFGHGRAGDVGELRRLGAELGFEVASLPPVSLGGRPVSSTRIREALGHGEVRQAQALMGRPYFIEGEVVRGDARGRALGFPTANLEPRNELLPRDGVYAARCGLAGEPPERPAVVNIGRRPTFDGREVRAEAHLLGFAGDLYGRELRLDFVDRLRDERRFDGPGPLVEQIRADVAQARRVLEMAT